MILEDGFEYVASKEGYGIRELCDEEGKIKQQNPKMVKKNYARARNLYVVLVFPNVHTQQTTPY